MENEIRMPTPLIEWWGELNVKLTFYNESQDSEMSIKETG